MRRLLLVLSEQVCPVETVKKRTQIYLATVEAETADKRVSFKPSLAVKNDQLSLSLGSVVSTVPCMIHCKMYTHLGYTVEQRRKTPDAEAFVPLRSARDQPNILWLPTPPASTTENKISMVTVIFMVYDIDASRPTTGLGLCLNTARLEGALCDVKLVVASGVELPAHRTVLAARSAAFNKMLTGDFKEARELRVNLGLEETSPAACKAAIEKFLEYLYTDRIQDWGESEVELLKLADMYMVEELRADCELELWSCDPPRALKVLSAAGLSEQIISSKLRRRLTATVQHNMDTLSTTALWKEFEKTYAVVVDSMLSLESEPLEGCLHHWSL